MSYVQQFLNISWLWNLVYCNRDQEEYLRLSKALADLVSDLTLGISLDTSTTIQKLVKAAQQPPT